MLVELFVLLASVFAVRLVRFDRRIMVACWGAIGVVAIDAAAACQLARASPQLAAAAERLIAAGAGRS